MLFILNQISYISIQNVLCVFNLEGRDCGKITLNGCELFSMRAVIFSCFLRSFLAMCYLFRVLMIFYP